MIHENLSAQTNQDSTIFCTWDISKMFHITSKYFSIFNKKPPASWVAHKTRDFLTCYSCSYRILRLSYSARFDSIVATSASAISSTSRFVKHVSALSLSEYRLNVISFPLTRSLINSWLFCMNSIISLLLAVSGFSSVSNSIDSFGRYCYYHPVNVKNYQSFLQLVYQLAFFS